MGLRIDYKKQTLHHGRRCWARKELKGGAGLGRLSVHSALEAKHIPPLRWDHQEEAGRKKRLSLWFHSQVTGDGSEVRRQIRREQAGNLQEHLSWCL